MVQWFTTDVLVAKMAMVSILRYKYSYAFINISISVFVFGQSLYQIELGSKLARISDENVKRAIYSIYCGELRKNNRALNFIQIGVKLCIISVYYKLHRSHSHFEKKRNHYERSFLRVFHFGIIHFENGSNLKNLSYNRSDLFTSISITSKIFSQMWLVWI